MGADKAIHVEVSGKEYETLQPLHVSKLLAKIAQDEKADIIIVGKQVSLSIYDFSTQKSQFKPHWKPYRVFFSFFFIVFRLLMMMQTKQHK